MNNKPINNPLVSIIMGVYNDEKYLRESIDSILDQTYDDFEFIICNDGSSDHSVDIVKEFSDSRIVFINNERNIGLAGTLNKCIEKSRGTYIARMDSDDRSLKQRIEKQVKFMEENKTVGVVGTQAYFIDEKGYRYKKFERKLKVSLLDTVKQSNLIHPSTMIRKEALSMVHGYTVNDLTARAEDYDLWCKIAEAGFEIANLEEFLFEYRENIEAYKKRKYKYRIHEFKIKKHWINKVTNNKFFYIYALKPLIVGLIPSKMMLKRKIK